MFIRELAPGGDTQIPETAYWILAVDDGVVVALLQGQSVTLTMRAGELQPGPFSAITSCTMRIRVGSADIPVRGFGNGSGEAGAQGSPSPQNKRMPAMTTASDGAQACAIPVAATPIGYVSVAVNGIMYAPGSDAAAACFFAAPSAPTVARAGDGVAAGDLLYWRGSVAGFQLSTSDVIDFFFNA